ncbi:hypothetical protein HUA76_03720 [Myxococcus sp. CA056]|uniref:DUF456 domain-containing protein n=1 Tax=Myxococcus sp. CA056 TaxID=2741740 RepID=UPI00157BA676|nr:DUF456 domain-containing protein [Myxococcus sp. CA056]NTX09887.1 hypothetical protein [Myxococcus sp. CA056]
MSPPVSNNGNNAAQIAAAEAQRRQAEEARRRAEEARKAAENQKKAAAEAQKKAAETQKKKASEAQQKARTDASQAKVAADKEKSAKAAKETAQTKANEAQAKVDTLGKGPNLSDQARKDLDAATKVAKDTKAAATKANDTFLQAQKDATAARQLSDTSHNKAIEEGNKAIQTQKSANTSAKAVGEPPPYADANQVRDVFDAGSLDPKAQERLFGTKSVVSPEEAVRADAKAVGDASIRSPADGAKELRRQVEANPDPAYREALMKESRGAINLMTSSLGRPEVTQDQANQIVSDLSHAAEQTSPQASRDVADSFRRAETEAGYGHKVEEKLTPALKAGAKDPAVTNVARGLVDGLRADGKYDLADVITRQSPELEKVSPQNAGQTKARAELDVQSAKEGKDTVATQQKQLDEATRGQVDELFTASKDQKPPEGFEAVDTKDPHRVEFVQKDPAGEVTARISATRDDKNNVTLDTSTVDPQSKQVTREVVTSNGPEGTTTSQTATWTPAKGQDIRNPPSIEDLKKSRDPAVAVEESKVSRDNGDLLTTTYKQGGGGVEGSETRFSQQEGEGGLDDNFKDKFNEDQPIDRTETKSYSIPPPGTKGPDGKDLEPSYTRTQTFSQGEGVNEVQATATMSKALTAEDGFNVDKGPRNAGDLSSLSGKLKSEDGEKGEAFDGDKDNPKQWVLEKTDGRKYSSQTFIEGHPDISVVTERTAKGNTVEETVKGKVYGTEGDKKGEPVDISSTSSHAYDDKGILTNAKSETKGADGVTTKQDYQRTDTVGPDGRLQVDERSSSTRTPPGGQPTTVTSERQRRESDAGVLQLVNASKNVTGPDGSSQVRVTPEKTELSVNGKPVPEGDLGKLDTKERALLDVTRGEMAKELYNLAMTPEPGTAKEESEGPISKPESTGDVTTALSINKDVLGLIEQDALNTLMQETTPPTDPADPPASGQTDPAAPPPGDPADPPASGQTDPAAPPATDDTTTPPATGDADSSGTPDGDTGTNDSETARLAKFARGVQVGAESLGIVGNTLGALSSGADLVNNISQGNYVAAAQNVADIGGGVGGIVQGVAGIRGGSELATGIAGAGNEVGGLAGLRAASTTASGFREALAVGGKLGAIGTGLGVVSGGLDIVGGIQAGDGWQIAKGGVSIAGAIGAGVAVGAIGGPVGAGVGLLIGVGVYGVGKLFDKMSEGDKEHQIAGVEI